MKKYIIAAALVATLVVPAAASADVQRNQEQTATFTVTQPAGAEGQWDNVWTHDYKVTVNPCDDTFTGTGSVTGHDQNGQYDRRRDDHRHVRADGISFTAKRPQRWPRRSRVST